MMLQEYAREHVLTCLIPAFFIAGAITFAIITGLMMSFLFRKEDAARATGDLYLPEDEKKDPPSHFLTCSSSEV